MINHMHGLIFQCPLDTCMQISEELQNLGFKNNFTYTQCIIAEHSSLLYNIELYIDTISATALKIKYSSFFLRNF